MYCFVGMEVTTANGKHLVTSVHLLAVTLDLPARAMVANSKQFNGKFGCSICLDEGAGRPDCPMHRYWPYQPECILRTHQSWLEDARGAVAAKEAVSIHFLYHTVEMRAYRHLCLHVHSTLIDIKIQQPAN
jgi:hypothetical protein